MEPITEQLIDEIQEQVWARLIQNKDKLPGIYNDLRRVGVDRTLIDAVWLAMYLMRKVELETKNTN